MRIRIAAFETSEQGRGQKSVSVKVNAHKKSKIDLKSISNK